MERKSAAGFLFRVIGIGRDILPEVVFTIPHNISGLPGISLPLHWSADRLPCGVQFLTKHANDGLLFRLAVQLEKTQPWFDKVPPIHA